MHGVTFIEPSPILEGYFDVPEVTLDFLQKFRDANATILQQLPLSREYDLHVPDGSNPPTTLYGLCTWGLADMWFASIATKFLLDELAKIQK